MYFIVSHTVDIYCNTVEYWLVNNLYFLTKYYGILCKYSVCHIILFMIYFCLLCMSIVHMINDDLIW